MSRMVWSVTSINKTQAIEKNPVTPPRGLYSSQTEVLIAIEEFKLSYVMNKSSKLSKPTKFHGMGPLKSASIRQSSGGLDIFDFDDVNGLYREVGGEEVYEIVVSKSPIVKGNDRCLVQ
jgi:hypothetical protein